MQTKNITDRKNIFVDYFSDYRYRFPAAGNQLKKAETDLPVGRIIYLSRLAGTRQRQMIVGTLMTIKKNTFSGNTLKLEKSAIQYVFQLFVTK